MLNPGTLNRKITLQVQSNVADEFGQQQQAWRNLRDCWAAIHPASSKEVYVASGFATQLTHVITIRYNAAALASAGMRVLYNGTSFRIQAISDPNEAHEVQQLLCLQETDPDA